MQFFNKKPSDDKTLQDVIDDTLNQIHPLDKTSDEAKILTERLTELYKIKNETSSRSRVSPDALVSAAASLAGIIAIIGFERANVITTKALSFVKKP